MHRRMSHSSMSILFWSRSYLLPRKALGTATVHLPQSYPTHQASFWLMKIVQARILEERSSLPQHGERMFLQIVWCHQSSTRTTGMSFHDSRFWTGLAGARVLSGGSLRALDHGNDIVPVLLKGDACWLHLLGRRTGLALCKHTGNAKLRLCSRHPSLLGRATRGVREGVGRGLFEVRTVVNVQEGSSS